MKIFLDWISFSKWDLSKKKDSWNSGTAWKQSGQIVVRVESCFMRKRKKKKEEVKKEREKKQKKERGKGIVFCPQLKATKILLQTAHLQGG